MSAAGHSTLAKLGGEQADAANPLADVWLSASAGTGKTHVLAARVFRLLLSARAKPQTILCLTYTKAGAAEMAERVHKRLAAWVRATDNEIRYDLEALGEVPSDDALVSHARTLFASVLDARGGGLRIQTIHSFCQALLGSFPVESGLVPGFRALEPREAVALRETVLGDLLTNAAPDRRAAASDMLREAVLHLNEERLRAFLYKCAAVPDAMAMLPEGSGLRVWLAQKLCNGVRDPHAWLAAACEDAKLPMAALRAVLAANENWVKRDGEPNVQGRKSAEIMCDWLALSPSDRSAALTGLSRAWLKTDGNPYAKTPPATGYAEAVDELISWYDPLSEIVRGAAIVNMLSPALRLGQMFSQAYGAAKQARGLADFDDLIRQAAALLRQPDIGDWIRFKLDQATDHILIDEAQDTNAIQWEIIEAIADDFYAGAGAKGRAHRTMFTVGDYKQAIFGFQGTNPHEFGKARDRFVARARGIGRDFANVALTQSFRSTLPVLAAVDAVIEYLGPERFGLAQSDPEHRSDKGDTGVVTLWPPVSAAGDAEHSDDAGDGSDDDAADASGDEAALTVSEDRFARDVARQIKAWLADPFWLHCKRRPVGPGDIMVLVRARASLARAIVGQLHAADVPVAGLDRLQLANQLAVRDLLACARFAVQPADDLTLAALLVSPIIGWSHAALEAVALTRTQTLWRAIEGDTRAQLSTLLTLGDTHTPYQFFETILSGAFDARRKLIARLGAEVRDPIDELLNAARAFETSGIPSLQAFIDWFDRGKDDVARDPSASGAAVRVMTVHAAKGLQAPVVILADATRDPNTKRPTIVEWAAEPEITLPMVVPAKANRIPALNRAIEASEVREREEHWRLLYVAMTRAEERLYVGGALSTRQQKSAGLSEDCWHSAVAHALHRLGAVQGADGAMTYGSPAVPGTRARRAQPAPTPAAVPDWLHAQAPAESRPPRPLAPSSLGHDTSALPPPTPAMRNAADRGRWLHALFERLPAVPPEQRAAAADAWLARSAGIEDAVLRAELTSEALAIIEAPDYADIFAPDALAEAPIAGVVEGLVIAGTVDRLLVRSDAVLLIDFKTGVRVPAAPHSCPVGHLRQMAAYAALLRGIFPGRALTAGLLYTAGPKLHVLGDDLLAAHKPPYLGT